MQHDVDTVSTTVPIHFLGINQIGQEGGNDLMCQGRTLPWLQDLQYIDVWRSWQVTERDVVVLDGSNKVIQVYNLTEHNLSDPANYAALRDIVLTAAGHHAAANAGSSARR